MQASDDWVVHPIPVDEYSIFVDPGFRYGTFGHPWEWTLHVFGASLVGKLGPTRIPGVSKILRKDGRPA